MARAQVLTKVTCVICLCILSLFYVIFTTNHGQSPVPFKEKEEQSINLGRNILEKNEPVEINKFIRDYITYHKAVASNKTLALQAQYLVVNPTNNGWGNRFNTMITTLLMAMVTGRIWMIGPATHPVWWCLDFPMNVSWANLQAEYNLKNTTEGKEMLQDHIRLHEDIENTKLLLAGDLKLAYKKQIVYYSGMDYQAPLLQRNPNYAQLIKDVFPDGAIYHKIFHAFFRLKPQYMEKVNNYSGNHFSSYTLGLHIRTKKINIVENQFCDLAKSILQQKKAIPDSTTVFIATDGRQHVWKLLTECLHEYKVVFIPDSAGNTVGGNPGSEDGALIDMFLLSKCNDIVITHSSSFGPTAAAIANIIPYSTTYPITFGEKTVQPIYFYQPFNSEPCMYYCQKIVNDFGEPYTGLMKADGMWLQYCQCYHI